MAPGGGVLALVAIVAAVVVRLVFIGRGWRGADQWGAITQAIKRQPETKSFGWLPPKNRSIRYVVGSAPDDVIDATAARELPQRPRLEARSEAAAVVLRRAVQEACRDRG